MNRPTTTSRTSAAGRPPRGWAKIAKYALLGPTRAKLSKVDNDAIRRTWQLLPDDVRNAFREAYRQRDTSALDNIDVITEIRNVAPAAIRDATQADRAAKWREVRWAAGSLPLEIREAVEALELAGDNAAWRLALEIVCRARG